MSTASSQPVVRADTTAAVASLDAGGVLECAPLDGQLVDRLWALSSAGEYGLEREEFERLLGRVGAAQNYGLPGGTSVTAGQQEAFFFGLKLADLALARACAGGSERAWERFVFLYREPLRRAAIAMTGSDSLGGDLADALYAELYGLTARDGERRSPLDSYKGRGSLLAWLRTTLAQRHVDRHRRTFREQPLDTAVFDPPAPEPALEPQARELAQLAASVAQVLDRRTAAERFLLSAYFLDGRTLASIGKALGVHEATVSRQLRRLLDDIRRDLLRALEAAGLSRRAAREALGADPRDLELNLTKMLQSSQLTTFPEKAAK